MHSSSHLCSPRSPVTSPLCVSRAARQVSEASSSLAKASCSFPGTLDRVTEGSLAPSAGRAEPCPEPGSRCGLLPAAPSGRQKAVRGGWTVWTRRTGWGLQTSHSGDQRRSRQWGHAGLRQGSHPSASCPCLAFVSQLGEFGAGESGFEPHLHYLLAGTSLLPLSPISHLGGQRCQVGGGKDVLEGSADDLWLVC